MRIAFQDIYEGLVQFRLSQALAKQDIRLKYRRSTLGPLWITLSMAITVTAMGPLYGALFNSNLQDFIPHLALGMIFWAFIANSLLEFADAFTSSEHILRQAYLPLTVLIIRVFYRQCAILMHNALIYPFVALSLGITVDWHILWAIPGFLLVALNMLWIGIIIAVFCTRYRDMLPIIQSAVTLLFFITPIIWNVDQLPKERQYLAHMNPFTSFLALLRDPVLGQIPSKESWIVAGIIAIVGVTIALYIFARTRKKITYWL